MKPFYHVLKKSNTWMAAVLIVAFSFPFVGNAVDAASSNQGFVIHADTISGKMLPPTIVVENGQPVVQFKYESATIHGLTLTNVSQTSIGPATLKVQAPLVTAKQMEVDATSYSFGGACLKLGKGVPRLVLKDVTLVAKKQTAEDMQFQHLQVRTIPGDHGLKRPPVPGLLGGLASTGSSTLQDTIAELMKAHVPLLQCNADQNSENQGSQDNQNNTIKKTTDGAKDTADQTVKQTKDTVNQTVDQGKDTVHKVLGKGGDTVDHTIDQVKKGADDILNGTGDTVGNVTGEVGKTTDNLSKDVGKTVDDVTHGNTGDVPKDLKNTVNHALEHAKNLEKDLLSGTTDLLDKIDGKNNQLSTLAGKLQDQVINPLQQTLSGSLTNNDVDDLKSIIHHASDHHRLKNRLEALNNVEADVHDYQSQLNDLKNKYRDLKNNSQAEKLNKLDKIHRQIKESQDKLKGMQSKINRNQSKIKNLLEDSKNALEQKNTGIFGLLGSLISNVLGDVKNLLGEVGSLLH